MATLPSRTYPVPPCPWCDREGGERIASSFAWTIHESCEQELIDWLNSLPEVKSRELKNRFVAVTNGVARAGRLP